jgi:UDP-N-acetyl-D-glucosamine dehydrogenase
VSEHATRLGDRIRERAARIGVVGLGYVGLPTAVSFAAAGFRVVGIDRNEMVVAAVGAGGSHVEDVSAGALEQLVSSGRLRTETSIAAAGDIDVIDICVPTPLDKTRDPDMSAILAVVEELSACVRAGQLVVLTSTTYPGTTAELIQPALEGRGLVAGEDVFIAFAPERIDPGNPSFGMRNTPKVIGGVTPQCTALASQLFETIVDRVVPVSSPTAAETVKLLENTFRSVNIALANEVAIMCRYLGVDVWEVIDAASTKPYGFMPFYPGPGLGGHCIPVDPNYLSWKLRGLNYVARFIALAEDINSHMPEYVVSRAADLLNEQAKSVRGSRILVLGVAYKPNVADLRESPALDVIGLLLRRGADAAYSDPHVAGPVDVDGTQLCSVRLDAQGLRAADLVIVATPHLGFEWDLITANAALVLDTRGWSHGRGLAGWHTL